MSGAAEYYKRYRSDRKIVSANRDMMEQRGNWGDFQNSTGAVWGIRPRLQGRSRHVQHPAQPFCIMRMRSGSCRYVFLTNTIECLANFKKIKLRFEIREIRLIRSLLIISVF